MLRIAGSSSCIINTSRQYCSSIYAPGSITKIRLVQPSFDTATITDLLEVERVCRRRLALMSRFLIASGAYTQSFSEFIGVATVNYLSSVKKNPVLCSENSSSTSCERSRRLNWFAAVSCWLLEVKWLQLIGEVGKFKSLLSNFLSISRTKNHWNRLIFWVFQK